MAGRLVARQRIVRVTAGAAQTVHDELAVEEPLEIRVDGQPLAVTMRTPGHDFDLALGFCLNEGVVTDAGEVSAIRYCVEGEQHYNVVTVQRRSPAPVAASQQRLVAGTSACGVCGTASIAALRRRMPAVLDDAVTVDAATIAVLPDRLHEAQRVFARTGGLHAAGLFDAEGALQCAREDVGRHNAVDKVLGWAAAQSRLPLRGHVMVVSGRVAFEIVQKSLVARIPIVVAVSAPTSLAVDLAREAGSTLLGFVRGGGMNVYAGGQRIRGLETQP